MGICTHDIVGPRPGRRLLITGGVHGDEFEPMVAIRRLISCWPASEMRGRVTLVPVVNRAAFQRGSRTAEDGLDLARTCPGSAAGSVTERTAHDLSALIREVDFYIDLHSGGATMQLLPLAGYVLHADAAVLDVQRRMAQTMNLPVVWGTNARLEGRSLSVARDAGVPAIYAEYGGSGLCDPQGVEAYVEGCLNVAGMLGLIDRPASISQVLYTVEDDRDNSGYLQIQHPAPAAGCFEPCVTLGDLVERGQSLGDIVDELGRERHDVLAADTGRVLLLRTFPHVAVGDTLAVILPIREPGSVTYPREAAG
ncbi:MAG: succinylglutamate desuccinylase/aspartoacylase family protein [Pirellulales bacterium]|nr:succinylglutamate desuccinylase/aspartoacylase family protein [Pirellulales bacterium]